MSKKDKKKKKDKPKKENEVFVSLRGGIGRDPIFLPKVEGPFVIYHHSRGIYLTRRRIGTDDGETTIPIFSRDSGDEFKDKPSAAPVFGKNECLRKIRDLGFPEGVCEPRTVPGSAAGFASKENLADAALEIR